MVKDLVILNGGYGKRLKELTKNKPKCLVEINNITFLEYQLDYLDRFKIKNVFILTKHFSQLIEEKIFEIKKKYSFRIYIIKDSKNNLGTGGALLNSAINFIKKDFILIYGDTYANIDINKLIQCYKINNKSTISIFKNFNKYDISNIKIRGNLVYSYKKLSRDSFYIDYGLSIYKFKDLKEFKEKNNSQLFDLSKFISYLTVKQKLNFYLAKKRFYHIGNKKSLNEFKIFVGNNPDFK
jgi:NDP-sugar pyrophosphorylase family protein